MKHKNIFHIGFELSLLLKGIDGFLQMVGGVMLLYLNPARMSRLVALLTQHELSEDPRDVIANAMIRFSHSFSISTQAFGSIYLISHGVIKLFLILLLWRKKLWAYPLTIASLLLFIAYQLYRYAIQSSVFLLFLSAFDILMIALTWIEYSNIRQRRKTSSRLN